MVQSKEMTGFWLISLVIIIIINKIFPQFCDVAQVVIIHKYI